MYSTVTSWRDAGKDNGAWQAQHQLRNSVFGDRLSYDVHYAQGMEHDQFDTPNAKYIVVMKGDKAVACCRVIDTQYAIMLPTLWPIMLGNFDPTRTKLIEATRIAVSKGDLSPSERSKAMGLLLDGILSYASEQGYIGVVGIMPTKLFKFSLERRGCVTTYLADPIDIDGVDTIAGYVNVQASILKRAEKYGQATPLSTIHKTSVIQSEHAPAIGEIDGKSCVYFPVTIDGRTVEARAFIKNPAWLLERIANIAAKLLRDQPGDPIDTPLEKSAGRLNFWGGIPRAMRSKEGFLK